MTIRDLEPERDAPALVELTRETQPFATITVDSWLHRARSVPQDARLRAYVAEVDGHVVGEGWALLAWFEQGLAVMQVAVREEARGRGLGSALYERAIDHAHTLGAPMISTTFFENDAGVAFATARGFAEARAERVAVLDPRTVEEQPAAPVRSLLEADLRDAHRIDDAATRDMPSLRPHEPISWEEWQQHVLEHPLFVREGSFLAYADGEAAAVSLLTADSDSGRSTNFFTGTLPEFRGRGLGLAAKLASVHWAAEHGITKMSTMNDETNAPMLAINRRLGYEPAGRRVEFSRSAD
jgi:GNAT superfamily N-acetyltransferase